MFTDDSFEKKGFDAETFEARGGKRMYCPNCKTNRTWNRGFKKHKMDYSKGEKPRDFIFYVCQKCNYAHDPKTGKKMEDNWREMFGYDAETFEATDVGKRMKCRGCGQWEFVRGVAMNNFLKDDKGKWRCYDCLYDKPKHKVVVIGRGKHKPFVSEAETFEDCEVCYATVDKGTLNDVQAGRICNECHKMNQYEGGTKTIKTPYNAETFGAESNVAYTVYGIDDMNDLNNMMLWMEGGYYHNKEDAIAEAKEWWDSRNTLPLDEGGGVVKVWVSKTVEEDGVVDEMEKIISYGAETFEAETERVCDYCEREAKDMGMVTFPDGLAVCDICFEEQSGYAETFEAESVLVVGEMDGKKPVVKAFGIGTKDKNNFTPDFIKTMEHPLPAKNNNYDWENHAETFGAEGMPRLGGQEVWVRVETQKIGNNEGRMDSEIAGRITGYFTSEFAAHTDAKKRLDEYEAIPQRFMNYLHKYRSKITVISHLQGGIQNKIEYIATDRHGAESFAVENDPDFDKVKADRNKDGEISDWEQSVGNKVAKEIREGRKTSSKGIDAFAEPFEEIGISKPYARLGVIAAGITALAFGVNKLRK